MWNVMDMRLLAKYVLFHFCIFFPIQSCLEWLDFNLFFIYVLWLSWWLYNSANCFHFAIQASLLKMEIWWHLLATLQWVIFCNLFKSVTMCYLDIHINTIIEIDDGTLCVAHVKGPWLLPLMWNIFLTKYSNERTSKIDLPSDLKMNGVSPWVQLENLLVTIRISKFKRLLEIFLCLNILKFIFLNSFRFFIFPLYENSLIY
jgi:hypothetical protein